MESVGAKHGIHVLPDVCWTACLNEGCLVRFRVDEIGQHTAPSDGVHGNELKCLLVLTMEKGSSYSTAGGRNSQKMTCCLTVSEAAWY